MFDSRKSLATIVAAASVAGLLGAAPAGAQTLEVVMHSDVKILDPIWTTADITAQSWLHGLRHACSRWTSTVRGRSRRWSTATTLSPDGLTWTFTLRDGLKWHDGKPVTSEDCIASIKRWAARILWARR